LQTPFKGLKPRLRDELHAVPLADRLRELEADDPHR